MPGPYGPCPPAPTPTAAAAAAARAEASAAIAPLIAWADADDAAPNPLGPWANELPGEVAALQAWVAADDTMATQQSSRATSADSRAGGWGSEPWHALYGPDPPGPGGAEWDCPYCSQQNDSRGLGHWGTRSMCTVCGTPKSEEGIALAKARMKKTDRRGLRARTPSSG